MRVPLTWLGEYVDLDATATPESVHEALVSVGLEEEDIHTTGLSGPIVVGQVLDFTEEPQKNGKTIRWCSVRVAEDEDGSEDAPAVRGIVCGAANFAPGDKVVVTLPGAVLPGPFPISARKTYGHVSDGMIASERELGLGDDHGGILVLGTRGLDPAVGTDAVSLLGLDDSAVEINVTPDRGYAFSIRGVAREYSHATGGTFRDPAHRQLPQGLDGVSVTLADDGPIRGNDGCSVFATRVVRGVDAGRPTPPWMVARLALAGIRSVSVVVDVTNYVMLETGQPLHGYDLAALQGGIVVRRAAPGETLTTIDSRERALDQEDLVIADDRGAIGLAGVMGGAETEISTDTSDVLIEAAHFDPVSIARTARRHKLPSEASKRFERGVDPKIAAAAADRAAELLVELAGGTVTSEGGLVDETRSLPAVRLPYSYPGALVGAEYTPEQIRQTLTLIGCDVVTEDDAALVTPPSWRSDLSTRADLVEEIARIIGYASIPSVLPVAPPGQGLSRSQRIRRTVSTALAAGGHTEVLAYPFVTSGENALFGGAESGSVASVALANALDARAPYMRRSLLPGLLTIAHRNVSRGLTSLSLFELGLVFLPQVGKEYALSDVPSGVQKPTVEQESRIRSSIPPQPRHIALVALGDRVERQPGQEAVPTGISDALDAVRQIEAAAGVTIDVTQGSHQAFHPGRTARLSIGDLTVGWAGEIHPDVTDDYDLPRVVSAVEIDVDAIIASGDDVVSTERILTHPAATQDLSLIVPRDVPAGAVCAAVEQGAGELLEDIRLVDVYDGEGMAEGEKSVTVALRFRAGDRTLTAAEASEAKLAGAACAGELFGASVRE